MTRSPLSYHASAPPPLRSGSRVEVVAPSGPFAREQLQAGLRRIEGEFSVHVPPTLGTHAIGFFAADDAIRLAELQAALDGRAEAILVARGGYGLARLIPRLSWDGFVKHPKWICGFSDATALHLACQGLGIQSIHAANGTTLAEASPGDLSDYLTLLHGGAPRSVEGLSSVIPGHATGPLVGGNLTVLFTEAASGRLTLPPHALLFVEDVTETSYRVDRMLTALLDGGHLSNVAGLLLGDFTECSSGRFNVPVQDVLSDFAHRLGVPTAAGLPVGHGARNRPLPCGARASLDTGAGHLTFDGIEA